MKKTIISVSVILILLITYVLFVFFYDWFILDHSAEYNNGEGELYWKDAAYVSCSGKYTEGKILAKTSDGNWKVKSVKEDDTHAFVVVRSILDQYLLVREDYVIPTSGKVTAVFWNEDKIVDSEFCQAVDEIVTSNGETFEYETDAIFVLREKQYMKPVYLCYEDCPVGTNYMGYMGKVNDKWVITTGCISSDNQNEVSSSKLYKVICKEIPQQYIPILERYLS